MPRSRAIRDKGRPSKLTPELIAKIQTAIETSNLPMDRITIHCGITKQAYYKWINKGEALVEREQLLANSDEADAEEFDEDALTDHERLCMQLYQILEPAYTFRENRLLSTIENIALKKGDWRALQWLLKISHSAYRTAEMLPELEPEEEDEYEEEADIFKTPAPSENEV